VLPSAPRPVGCRHPDGCEQAVSESDIFWAAHGAGMVHMPLLPPGAVVIEMFNCGHFSYLYANMALNLRIKYFAMQRTEPYCYTPQSMHGDTRRNLTKQYAYTVEEAEPVLMQAVRYRIWLDPGPSLTGHESLCAHAAKAVELTGALPPGTNTNAWLEYCLPVLQRNSSTSVGGWSYNDSGSTRQGLSRRRRAQNAWASGPGMAILKSGAPGSYTKPRRW